MKNHQPARRGLRLADGTAHAQDHNAFSRRNFLRNLGLVGTGSILMNRLPVSAAGLTPLTAALNAAEEDRVLVLIRLKGGNDGLNTFIPVHDFGTYQAARPQIYVKRNEAVDLTSTLSMHPRMAPLQSLWNEGQMRVVQNVGYPGQNLSHFRSSDIWATTSDADVTTTSGVLGRYLQEKYPDFLSSPPDTPPAIQIGGTSNLLFNNDENFNYAISSENPNKLYEIAKNGQLYNVDAVPDCSYGEQLGYLRAVANTTFRYAGVLAAAFDQGANRPEYVNDRLGDQLSLVARLLKGGLGTRLFVVEIDGFDTHANQAEYHAQLLGSLSENVRAFYEDLTDGGQQDRVLSLTFSEFGRRIEQNGSMGTDHGAAAPVMLFGPGLNGNGAIGGLANLEDVTRGGNLKHRVDFRAIYATVLSRWLCIDGDSVDALMGGSFERMDDLGLACASTGVGPTSVNDLAEQISMKAYLANGQLILDYDLPASGDVRVSLHDTLGRRIDTSFTGRRPAGPQQQRMYLKPAHWAAGVYVVSVEYEGRAYSRKLGVFR